MPINTITGTTGPDTLYTTSGDDSVSANAGNDTIYGSVGADSVDGGIGFDTLLVDYTRSGSGLSTASNANVTMTITDALVTDGLIGGVNTQISGVERVYVYAPLGLSSLVNTIDASGFTGSGGVMYADRTVLWTPYTRTNFIGSNQGDTLSIAINNSIVDGGLGNDFAQMSTGMNTVIDNYLDAQGHLAVRVAGTQSSSTYTSLLYNIERLQFTTSFFSDHSIGTTINASAMGASQAVEFVLGSGWTAIGGAGDDTFTVNATVTAQQTTTLTGGAGADVYNLFPDPAGSTLSLVGLTITDFSANDALRLNRNSGSYQFIGSHAFSNVANQVRYDKQASQTVVQFDHNGDGITDASFTLTGSVDLVSTSALTSTTLELHIGTPGSTLLGGAGADSLTGTIANDMIFGNGGNDVIIASSGTDAVDGGAGTDRLIVSNISPGVETGTAADSFFYTASTGRLFNTSNSLNSYLANIENVEVHDLRVGNSTVNISGYTGSSFIELGNGNHQVTGGSGADTISLGIGSHTVDGGTSPPGFFDRTLVGLDTAYNRFAEISGPGSITSANDPLYIESRDANMVASLTSISHSFAYVRSGTANGLYLNAQRAMGTALGFGGNVGIHVYDSAGSDMVLGSGFTDYFLAQPTAGGLDTWAGGGGADTWIFNQTMTVFGGDTIVDFDSNDKIETSSLGLASAGPEPTFIGTAAFSHVAAQLRYEVLDGRTYLQFDRDGDGVADGTITMLGGEFALKAVDTRGFGASTIMRATARNLVNGNNAGVFNETLNGTTGDDEIRGLRGDDILSGAAGNDLLDGGRGADAMSGGAGDDTYIVDNIGDNVTESAGEGTDEVLTYIDYTLTPEVERLTLIGQGNLTGIGNALANTIWGNTGDNFLSGLAGNDALYGGDGNDQLSGGTGADLLDGGAGFDFAVYSNAAAGVVADLLTPAANIGDALGDTYTGIEGLIGSAFADLLRGNGQDNWIYGGAGGDTFDGYGGNDTMLGEDGNDLFVGGAGADAMYGGAGFDYVSYAQSATGLVADLAAPAGNTGDALGDTFTDIEGLVGSSFNDILNGDALDNWIYGGNGSDVLFGRDGADVLLGEAGIDYLYGDAGADNLIGAAGDDHLTGGAGADILNGGDGFDYAHYDAAPAGLTVDMVNNADNTGEAVGDFFVGIDAVVGSAFDDSIRGNDQTNWLYGGQGNDFLYGRAGLDYLLGGAGSDYLFGGTGTDVLYGEAGADRFVFSNGEGIDYVMDFSHAQGDVLYLSAASLGVATFADVQARMVQSGSDTVIGFNANSIMVVVGVTPAQFVAADFVFG